MSPLVPHAIIMMGIPGSGKSTFAEKFAESFNSPIVNQYSLQRDNKLNHEQSVSIAENTLKQIIKSNRTFLYEGDTYTEERRDELAKRFKKLGFKPLIVWVQTDSAEAKRRATLPHPKGSDMSEDKFYEILDKFEVPGKREKFVVISGRHTFATQLRVVLRHIAADRPIPSKIKPAPRPEQKFPSGT